ncbi:MAG: flagellar export chaperone FliS, partial [Proteobacteria bacterium]|nr:flagellar export chaperone FliS [Pseudomonadota bacterium]
KTYQKISVNTSNQKQLIVMLYDGMHRYLNQAIQAIDKDDLESAHQSLHSTGKILLELLSTLREDKGGEIATNLKKMYVYCYEQIVVANLKKDKTTILEIQSLLAEIGEGWRNIHGTESSGIIKMQEKRNIRVAG